MVDELIGLDLTFANRSKAQPGSSTGIQVPWYSEYIVAYD